MKGGILLPDTGYIDLLAYTGTAQIPLSNVAISVTATDGTALALRITDRNGLIQRIEIPVPDTSAGLSPNTGVRPYTAVNLFARKDGYEQTENENLQVFPQTVTRLNLEMIPLSEMPNSHDKIRIYDTPPQNL